MKIKLLTSLLVVLVVILIVIFSFSFKENTEENNKIEQYKVEEITPPEDIQVEETGNVPVMEEPKEDVELLGEVEIEIKNWKFYPEEIIISPGTTIVWVNNDSVPHKPVAYDRIFYSSRLEPGDKYSFTFTNAGEHRYFDAVFPKSGRGKIIVKEEPLPITGGVVGVDLGKQEMSGQFALIIILFVVMVVGLSHGIYKHHRI